MENRVKTTEPGGAVGGLVGHCQSMVDNSSQNNPNLKSPVGGVLANHQYDGNQGWV